jgi:hypothetical protein
MRPWRKSGRFKIVECRRRRQLQEVWAEALRQRVEAEAAMKEHTPDSKAWVEHRDQRDAMKAEEDAAYRRFREHIDEHKCE